MKAIRVLVDQGDGTHVGVDYMLSETALGGVETLFLTRAQFEELYGKLRALSLELSGRKAS